MIVFLSVFIQVIATLLNAPISESRTDLFAIPNVRSLGEADGAASTDAYQPSDVYLSSLTSANSSLSNDHITAICVDSYGFVWIGTASGLNRFDTHNLETFRNDDLGLYTDYVRAIYEDSSGDVWVGTDSGLTIYDRDMDVFVPVSCKSDKGNSINRRVTCIEERAGKIWISVGGQGFFCYDKAEGSLKQFPMTGFGMNVKSGISSFAFDDSGGILASFYHDNLYYFDKESFADGSYLKLKPVSDGFGKDHITSVCHIRSGCFAVTSLHHGLCIVDVKTGDYKILISNTDYSIPNTDRSFIPSRVIFRDDKLFMATNYGLYVYSLPDGRIRRLHADSNNGHSLRSNDINCLEYSSAAGLWIGFTGTDGINFSIPGYDKFKRYLSENGPEGTNGINVTDFAYNENKHSLYVSTSDKGIFEYSFSTKSLTRILKFPLSVKSICCHDNAILIGSSRGLYEYDLTTGELVREKTFSQLDINVVKCTSDKSRVVIGTTLGLFIYDRTNRSFDKVKELGNCSVTSFVTDNRGWMWISTVSDGVFRLDIGTGKVQEHLVFNNDDKNTIPNNRCSSVNIDNNGKIWVSTIGSGFCKIDDGIISRYSMNTHHDLPSNCFYGIINDKNGNYWAKTDKGLVKCDFNSGRFHTFDSRNGLSDNNLIGNAQWESINGELFFGSSDGFFSLNPDSFIEKRENFDEFSCPVFTNMYLSGGRKVIACETESPIKKGIDNAECIDLPPWENSFRIKVSAGRLSNMPELEIDYILDGYETCTHILDKNGVISYSNLPSGLYTLYVKGHEPLTVKVGQYWYLMPAAFLLYFLVLAALIAMIARYFYVLSAKRMRRRQEMKLFDEKLTFYSNVIHEIRTPIMLIKSPLKHLLESKTVALQHKEDINVISQNVNYLSGLAGELLDYIRNEKNRRAVSVGPVDVKRLINSLNVEYAAAAIDKHLEMHFSVPQSPVVVMAEESSLVRIFHNLLHNALKYASSKIEVEVSSEQHSSVARIVVSNDGKPIPEDKREEIFKPFVQYISENSFVTRRGFGIGLAYARSLAEGLGASLVLDSKRDDGMISFVMTLKLADDDAEVAYSDDVHSEALSAGSVSASDASADGVLGETLMVVEDNQILLEYLQKTLSRKYTVVVAENGEDALEILRRRRISLVISDISLPNISGIELCKKISSSIWYSHIPVILISSFSSSDVKIKAVDSGAVLFLEKPFDMDYLAANVDSFLAKSFVTVDGDSKPLSEKLKLLSQKDKLFLANMDNYIKENISDVHLDNESLARNMGMSVPTLQRKVKSLTGLTPNRYIRRFRMNVGAQLLATGKCQVSEVSYNVGFDSPSYFSKLFREEFGCLPQDYMRRKSDKVDL